MPNLKCDKLSGGRCTVYPDRPLICRLFGVVEQMRCPFGCVPERFLSERAAYALLERAEKLAGSGSTARNEDSAAKVAAAEQRLNERGSA
jgi:Fe-S-cluster containining protein